MAPPVNASILGKGDRRGRGSTLPGPGLEASAASRRLRPARREVKPTLLVRRDCCCCDDGGTWGSGGAQRKKNKKRARMDEINQARRLACWGWGRRNNRNRKSKEIASDNARDTKREEFSQRSSYRVRWEVGADFDQ